MKTMPVQPKAPVANKVYRKTIDEARRVYERAIATASEARNGTRREALKARNAKYVGPGEGFNKDFADREGAYYKVCSEVMKEYDKARVEARKNFAAAVRAAGATPYEIEDLLRRLPRA